MASPSATSRSTFRLRLNKAHRNQIQARQVSLSQRATATVLAPATRRQPTSLRISKSRRRPHASRSRASFTCWQSAICVRPTSERPVETRERISVAAFEQRYQDIWAEATIRGFGWEVMPQQDENASSHEVILRYQTTFFGEIEEVVQARTLRQPHWVLDWTPDLMFSGLGSPGFLIRTLIDTPPRGLIRDRNGVVLAGETEVTIVGVHWDSITDEEEVLAFFIDRLQIEEEDVRAIIYQDLPSYQFIPVASCQLIRNRKSSQSSNSSPRVASCSAAKLGATTPKAMSQRTWSAICKRSTPPS